MRQHISVRNVTTPKGRLTPLTYFWEIMVLRDSIVVYPEYVSAVQTRTGALTT